MKQKRQQLLRQLIQQQELRSQREVLECLRSEGMETNQATVSRDFGELGINKIDGVYRLPVTPALSSPRSLLWLQSLQVLPAGDNLLVVKTGAGQASLLGLHLDDAGLEGLVGTVAGDDTLFIAVAGREFHESIQTQLEQMVQLQTRKAG
jgi:transcriptional regulator of arginine metabolism